MKLLASFMFKNIFSHFLQKNEIKSNLQYTYDVISSKLFFIDLNVFINEKYPKVYKSI